MADRTIVSLKGGMLCAFILLSVSIQKGIPLTGLRVDFSNAELSSQLNGLFNSDGVYGMVEGRDWQSIEMVFPFICTYMDKAIVCTEDAELNIAQHDVP